MKFNKLAVLVVILLCGSVITTTAAYADEATNTVKAKSNAKVAFKINETGTTEPGNPGGGGTDPGEPGGSGGGTSEGGPLRIDFVSHMDFGTQIISGKTEQYSPIMQEWVYGEGEDVESRYFPQFIQISDDRGTNDGWDLQVSRTAFASGKSELTGEQLLVSNATVTNLSNLESSVAPKGQAKFEISQTATSVLTASEGQGMSTWALSFGEPVTYENASTEAVTNENIVLIVPGTSQKIADEEYAADLTWSLIAAEA